LLAAKLQAAIDLSDAADRLTLRTNGYPTVATQLASAGGDDQVRIRHRMFAIVDRTQLTFDAALGAGDDRLNLHAAGYDAAALSLDFAAGDDRGIVHVQTSQPKTEQTRQITVIQDMGPGDDSFNLVARGYDDARATLNTGPDGDGRDRIAATFVLPGQPGPRPRTRHLVTSHSVDSVRILGVGYTTADVSLEGSQCLVFFLGGNRE
jgi:hypothetical protein